MPTMFIVCCVLVHCRVGSLEIGVFYQIYEVNVHCRVGSLEMSGFFICGQTVVHCRVGSHFPQKTEENFYKIQISIYNVLINNNIYKS